MAANVCPAPEEPARQSEISWEEFENTERRRQEALRLPGFAVPVAGEPLDVWRSEACHRWAAVNPAAAAARAVEVGGLLRHARHELTAAEGAAVLEELQAAPLLSPGRPPAASSLSPEAQRAAAADEVRATLLQLELALRLYFADPRSSQPHLERLIRRVRPGVVALREQNVLRYDPGGHAELSVLYELACYRRLRQHWLELPAADRGRADAAALELCALFAAPEYQSLARAIGDPKTPSTMVIQLVIAAAQATRFAFPELLPRVRELFPAGCRAPRLGPTFCQAEKPAVAKAEGGGSGWSSSSSTVTTPGTPPNTPAGAGGALPCKSSRVEGQPDAAAANLLAATRHQREGGGAGGALPPPAAAEPPLVSDAPDAGPTVGDVVGLRKRDTARQLLGSATRLHPPASGGPAASRAGAPRLALAIADAATASVAGAGAGAAAAAAGRPHSHAHRHPCRSKYHARYSTPAKHGSAECGFCCVCHMLEFLFNGCVRDCTWRHYPTPKKIALHLRQFPSVCALASKRFDQMQCGDVPTPMEIPL